MKQVFVARDYRGELLGAYEDKKDARAHLEELAKHFYGELKWYGDRHLHCGENGQTWVGSIETLDILPRFVPPGRESRE